MSTSSSGFAQFRNSLQEAAAHSLERTHPNYVIIFQKALEETGDLDQALHAVKGISTDPGFAKWRPLLTATLDTELAMNEMRSALNLLKALPLEETLDMYSMSRGAWIYYHLNMWIFWMDALLEKQKTLVKEAVRALIRPRNTQWKDVESSLLSTIDVLSKDMGKVRDPLAHGGLKGRAAEAIGEERLWEWLVLLQVPLEIRTLVGSMVIYHARWSDQLHRASVLVLAEFNRVCEELNRHIDWDHILPVDE